ncbi:phospho-sugar mutase, partial [bacterium]|nr:phospho-sugar mutase [bacterium]
LKASAGIVVTASHNPKEYNGYKVYWSDGAQIVPPHDKGIIECVKRISEIELVKEMDFDAAREKGLVQILGSDVDEAYLQTILRLSVQPDLCVAQGGKMKIVYTPLHGTGITLVPEALERWGFQNVVICEEQSQPDGDFPNAPSPNPEEPEALKAAIRTAEEIDADLVLATDPDADRVGIAARIGEEYRLMSGNQIASLLVEYVLGSLARAGTLPPDARVVSTVVTTDLINRIAEHYGVKTDQTLTGFKWIGEKIRLYEEAGEGTYLVGGEESYGYLIGTHARDKDAVVSACFIAEMTADSLSKGQTLFDRLNSVFRRFGIFQESLLSMKFPGAEGQERIRRIMSFLRENAPDSFGGIAVDRVIDIQRNEIREGGSGKVLEKTGLPKSNVLIFRLADGSRIAARPSGTEPKIKFYFSVCDRENLPISSDEELERRQEALKCRHQALREEFKHEIDEASPQAGE